MSQNPIIDPLGVGMRIFRLIGSSIAPCDKIDIDITKVEWIDSYPRVLQKNTLIQPPLSWPWPIKSSALDFLKTYPFFTTQNTTKVDPDNFYYDGCSDKPAVYFISSSNATAHKKIKLKITLQTKSNCGSTLPLSATGKNAKLIIAFGQNSFTSNHFILPEKGKEVTITIEGDLDHIAWLKSPSFSLQYNNNGTILTKTNIISSKIILEAFVLYDEPASFYTQGVWVEALRFLFEKTKIDSDKEIKKTMEKITQYCHSMHDVKYETVTGKAAFIDGLYHTGIVEFNLMGYLKKKAKIALKSSDPTDSYGRKTYSYDKSLATFQRFNIINCYDQAGAIHVLSGALGIKSEWVLIDDFGYIPEVKLVGINSSSDFINLPNKSGVLCDNPFFSSQSYSPLRIVGSGVDTKGCDRSAFGNHAVCGILLNGKKYADYSDKNEYKKEVILYDACAGPALGLSYADYIKRAVDTSLPESSNYFATLYFATTVIKVKWYDI